MNRGRSATDPNAVFLNDVKRYSFDVVIHLAGRAHVLIAGQDNNAYSSSNVEFSMAVAEASLRRG